MSLAYVALGTNLGRRLDHLAEARRRLSALGALRRGPVLETDAWLPPEDPTPQPRYLNTVDELDTALAPLRLFTELKRIERLMGRVVTTRWAPRVIDLDLVLFDDVVLRSEALTVPHPRMHERPFVLRPLAALRPGLTHPVLGRTIAELSRSVT
ncbi:MAG: 2-amino-4-hydroxy-6-hydroxymethyldihydropteridine diphosphokinase [Myxococcota bacterium]